MNSARSKAQTEPEATTTREEDLRPVSSHEVIREDKEQRIPPPEAIEALAKHLDIPLTEGKKIDLDWVVRDCMISLREDGWDLDTKESCGVRDLVLKHQVSGELRCEHQIAFTYRELAKQVFFENEQLEQSRLDAEFRVRELVLDRLRRIRNPLHVSEPRIIERILGLLHVESSSEWYLIQTVKEELEAAFFQMKSLGGPEFLNCDNCISVLHLRTRIAIERTRFIQQISHSKLLFCVECNTRLADGSCASCGDCLCGSCFSRLHGKGSRQIHLFVFIDQGVCSECQVRGACIRCSDCGDLFCDECIRETHNQGKRVKHCIQLALPIFCLNCEISEARVLCLTCFDALCLACADRIHRRGARKNHLLYGIKSYAYPNKLFASNISDILRVLDKLYHSANRSSWYLFHDEQMGPYWYNFFTRQTISTSTEDETPAEPDGCLEHTINTAKTRAIFQVRQQIQIEFNQPTN